MIHMLLAPVHIHNTYASGEQFSYMTTFHADPIELDGPYCS
jgi:hypothetical protein